VLLVLLVAFSPAREDAADPALMIASREAGPLVAADKVAADKPAVDKVAARASIEKANAAWQAAFGSGDFAGMAALYTDDASLSAPGTGQLEGRGKILDYLSDRRARGMSDPALKTLDVVTMGEVAYETGTYRFTLRAGGDLAGSETGRYFVIWKAEPDGTWRYNLGIWTNNATAAAAR